MNTADIFFLIWEFPKPKQKTEGSRLHRAGFVPLEPLAVVFCHELAEAIFITDRA
jgi:hypothetical protein